MSIWRKKVIIGISPELVDQVRYKVKKLKEERDTLKKEYYDLMKRLAVIEGKIEAFSSTIENFKEEILDSVMAKSKEIIRKEINTELGDIKTNENLLNKIKDEVSKLMKSYSDLEYNFSFQDYYQLIKLCIFLITNSNEDKNLIEAVMKTIKALIIDMNKNGFYKPAKEAIMISLSNLKTYWDSKNKEIGMIIQREIDEIKEVN